MEGYTLPVKGSKKPASFLDKEERETELERRKRLQYEAMMREVGGVDDDDLSVKATTLMPPPPPSYINTSASKGGMFAGKSYTPSAATGESKTSGETKATVLSPKSNNEVKETWDDESDDEERIALEKGFNRAAANMKGTPDKRGSMADGADSDDEELVRKRATAMAIKPFLFEPAKKGAKPVQCYVVREKSGFTRSSSIFRVYLEESHKFLFSAKKRSKNKTANFIISSEENPPDDRGDTCIGKVRGNFSGSQYTIYDHGMNPDRVVTDATLRKELGIVEFSYDKMGPGKMFCAIPDIQDNGVAYIWKPREESERIWNCVEIGKKNKLIFLNNKRPKWDEAAQGHVLNFHGRVTKSSVKNFQLSCEITGDATVLQFGRIDKNKFTMDFQHPLSPLQAFGICLASLDDKLADSKGWETMTSLVSGKK